MNNSKPLILIVAPPGDLQIGLQALLSNRLDVDVLVTGKGSSAIKAIGRHSPAIVILDEALRLNNTPGLIQQIKSSWSEICCIVLVNDEERRQKILYAGADLIVIKGLPAAKLVIEIEKILFVEEEDHPMSKDFDGE